MPMGRWMRHTPSARPSSSSASCHGKNVLVDAIAERAIEIEEHGRSMRCLLSHSLAACALHIYEGVQVANSPTPV